MIATTLLTVDLHSRFLSILSRIELHGRVYFRHVKCPAHKADVISEMIALSWLWFVRLAHQGKDATQFPSALATFALRSKGILPACCSTAKIAASTSST